jgi:uncharacterized membrane protein
MPILMALYVVGGLILIALAVPLVLRKIPPNPLYGFRIEWTREDPELWYSVNAYTGKWLVFVGACSVIGAIVLAFIPGINLVEYAFGCLAVFGAPFILALIQSIRFLRMMESQK